MFSHKKNTFDSIACDLKYWEIPIWEMVASPFMTSIQSFI